jgi:hypothetical protein
VKILIRSGVTAPEAGELLRQVYVDAASSDEFQLPGRRLSDTRVAILTGLSRKEVHRLRRASEANLASSNLSRVGRVTAGWNQDPDFTGPYGLPLAIPFEDDPAVDAPSFSELVRRYSGDMAPRAMLDELLRTGLAEIDADGRIRSTGRTYIPHQLDPAAIELLGKVVGRLADTVDFNNRGGAGRLRFERHVVTDIGLTEEQYELFSIYLRQKCQQLLETLDDWVAMQEGRIGPERKTERLPKRKLIAGVGVYQFLDQKLPFEDGFTRTPSIEPDDEDD